MSAGDAGDAGIEALPEPQPAPDEAVVAIRYGGICGSDLHYWRHGAAGESILREPMVLGHEVVGTVLAAAADGSGPATASAPPPRPRRRSGRCRCASAPRAPSRASAMRATMRAR